MEFLIIVGFGLLGFVLPEFFSFGAIAPLGQSIVCSVSLMMISGGFLFI